MTPQQKIALDNPTLLAIECALPQYKVHRNGPLGPHTLITTVNTGYE